MAIQFTPITVKLVTRPNITLDDGEKCYTFEIHGWSAVLVRKGAWTKEQATEKKNAFRKFYLNHKRAIESGKVAPFNIMAMTVNGTPISSVFERKPEELPELPF